jgi:hypothetical protein
MARLPRAETIVTSGLPLAKVIDLPASYTPGSITDTNSRVEETKFIQTIRQNLAYNVATVVKGCYIEPNKQFTLEDLRRGGRNPQQPVTYQGTCIFHSD